MEKLVLKAAEFAAVAHGKEGHLRRGSNAPYIVHPAEVYGILVGFGFKDENLLAAAWLHDVVEDCPISLDDITKEFGAKVAVIVEGVTGVAKPEDGNKVERCAINRDHLKLGNANAHNLKLADILSNAGNVGELPVEFYKPWLKEKLADLVAILFIGKADAKFAKFVTDKFDGIYKKLVLGV